MVTRGSQLSETHWTALIWRSSAIWSSTMIFLKQAEWRPSISLIWR
jgi:hypothetical protein